ncbi:MAG: hypothetical protein JSR82_23465 [Verrucomicrobia bacterium]|nr:hypothetical protein [Verrucomicrobiota bacterium]
MRIPRLLAAALAALLPGSLCAAGLPRLFDFSAAAPTEVPLGAGVAVAQRVRLADEAFDWPVAQTFAVALQPAAPALTARVVESSEPRPGSRLLRAQIEGVSDSELLLVQRGGAWAGEIALGPARRWSVRDDGAGGAWLVPLPPTQSWTCANCLTPGSSLGAPPPSRPAPRLAPTPTATTPTFDVLAVYTTAARQRLGSAAAVEAAFDAAMARTNTIYTNSAVNLRGRIVRTAEIDFTESVSLRVNLDRLRADPNLQALRDQAGAHLVAVALDVQPGAEASGVADLLDRYGVRWGATRGYATMDVRGLRDSSLIYTHELGHTMGCDHNLPNASTGRLRVDACAWTFRAPDFNDYCTLMGNGGVAIDRFSNPALFFQQTPTGVFGAANNAAILRATTPFFTRFRPVPPLATVNVRASVPQASFAGGTAAELVLTRTGGVPELPMEVRPIFTFGDPDVFFQMEGLVANPSPGSYSLLFPAGVTELRVRIQPRGTGGPIPADQPRRILFFLSALPEDDYQLGESPAAEFFIADLGPLAPSAPRAALINLSTRLPVGGGDGVAIAGFVLGGSAPKRCLVRALGPTLQNFGVPGALADPQLELRDATGALVAQNDAWGDDPSAAEVIASGFAPPAAAECAVLRTLAPGAYTAVIRGAADGTGVALVEVYDLAPVAGAAQPINVSTRGRVETGDSVMIGGFVLEGAKTRRVLLRALGPTLTNFGVRGALADPTLELRDANGNLAASNDNWQQTQAAEIAASGFAPTFAAESALIRTLAPGSYTAIVRGQGNATGVGLVEVYDLDPL